MAAGFLGSLAKYDKLANKKTLLVVLVLLYFAVLK